MPFTWRTHPSQRNGRARQCASLLGAIIVALATTGCAGIRPYSEVRDKQAKAASDAWKDVNLGAEMSAHRANLQALLEAEKSAQDDVGRSIRDLRLRVLVSDRPIQQSLVDPLTQRMKRLNAGPMDQAALDKFSEKHKLALIQIPRAQNDFRTAGLNAPDCGSFKRPAGWKEGEPLTVPDSIRQALGMLDPGTRHELTQVLDENLAVHCAYESLLRYVAESSPASGGLGTAWKQYQDDLLWVTADSAKAEAAKKAYDVALAEYEAAVKRGTSDSALLQRVKDKLADLQKLTRNPFAEKIVSEEKLKSLNDYLAAVTTYEPGKDFPDAASKAARATALLPELADTIRSAAASSRKPLVAPYLLMKNHEQLKLEAFTRDVTARKQIAARSFAICEAMAAELLQLQDAQKLLNADKVADRLGASSMAKILGSGSGASVQDKRRVLEAAARYLDTIGRLEPQRYKLEYERIAAFHERTLAYSEVNAQQWENLIGVSLGQLSEFGAAGLKREDIIGLLNALGIIYIGVGVN
jgi:hypothetical protein